MRHLHLAPGFGHHHPVPTPILLKPRTKERARTTKQAEMNKAMGQIKSARGVTSNPTLVTKRDKTAPRGRVGSRRRTRGHIFRPDVRGARR